jgi:hypothetical protein
MWEAIAMPLYGEALVRALRNSPDAFENYVATQAVTRKSINIAHIKDISIGDKVKFVKMIMHNWLQGVSGNMARIITGALGFEVEYRTIAETYRNNSFECIKSERRQNEFFCGGIVPQCNISLFPNTRQLALLEKLASFVVEGGRRITLRHYSEDYSGPTSFIAHDLSYPLQINVDISNAQQWYSPSAFGDRWCAVWLQSVVYLDNVRDKMSLCRTTFDFGLGTAVASKPSVFVSTGVQSAHYMLTTLFVDIKNKTDFTLDSLGGWAQRNLHREYYGLNVTRFIGQYAENAFADIRGRSCGSAIYRPRLHPYDRWASEALVADNNATQDSDSSALGMVIFIGVALLLMVLGALIAYAYDKHRERRALSNEVPSSRFGGVEVEAVGNRVLGVISK